MKIFTKIILIYLMAYIPCFGQEESIFLRLNNAQNAFQITHP